MILGIAYRLLELPAASKAANLRGLAAAEKEIARNPRIGSTRANLGYLCARLGQRQRAEAESAQALQLSPDDPHVLWASALTYEALGRREDTLGVLKTSHYQVLAELSRWPDVADLVKDIRFSRLLASKRLK
jgi:tetratricopeptide (TPR) repeat protein